MASRKGAAFNLSTRNAWNSPSRADVRNVANDSTRGGTGVIATGARQTVTVSLGDLPGATWALGAGGLLFSLGNLLHPLQHVDAAYHTPTWAVAHLAIFFSLPLLLLGLPSLDHALRARGSGNSSRAAVWLAVLGLIGMAPSLLAEAYIAPELGQAAMQHLDATGFGVVVGLLSMAWVASCLVLAVACQRGRFGPGWTRVVLAVVAFALLVGATPTAFGGIVIILATAAYGVSMAALGWELGPR